MPRRDCALAQTAGKETKKGENKYRGREGFGLLRIATGRGGSEGPAFAPGGMASYSPLWALRGRRAGAGGSTVAAAGIWISRPHSEVGTNMLPQLRTAGGRRLPGSADGAAPPLRRQLGGKAWSRWAERIRQNRETSFVLLPPAEGTTAGKLQTGRGGNFVVGKSLTAGGPGWSTIHPSSAS